MTNSNSIEKNTSTQLPVVSITVPVYNAAAFLEKCLNSLLGQTLKNIEIICVNDGSTDDSLMILEDFAKRDSRIVVISQENKGVASTRNAGLKRARAPYLMYCDSDDWFEPDMCRCMVETLEREEVDVVICDLNITYDIPEELRENVEEYLRHKYEGKEKITEDLLLNTDVSLWNKIYKRSIVLEKSITYPDGLLFEDAYFNDAYMMASEYIYFLHEKLYNYLRHSDSIMSTSYKKTGTALDYLQVAILFWDYLEKENLLKDHEKFFWWRFLQRVTFAFKHLEGENLRKAKRIAKKFAGEHKESLANVPSRLRMGIKFLLYLPFGFTNTCFKLYKLCARIFR